MKSKMVIFLFASALVFGGSLGFFLSAARAQENLEVKIGPSSPSVAEHSHEHDITGQSLKQGNIQYELGSKPKDSHRITLTREQLADIVEGTTIIVESDKDQEAGTIKVHQHRVTFTLKVEPPDSGW